MESGKTKLQFSVGQYVVYPLQGVGIITNIRERTVRGIQRMYYVIYLDISDMTVSIPIDKIKDAGIRKIVTAASAKKAIDSISSKYEPINVDWKARYQMNVDLVKDGTIESVAKVVQILYHRSKIKELPVQERKLFDVAKRLLIDETSLALKKDKMEIEKLIFSKLEK